MILLIVCKGEVWSNYLKVCPENDSSGFPGSRHPKAVHDSVLHHLHQYENHHSRIS